MIFERQILRMYQAMAFARCDDMGLAFYYTADNFDGLCKEEFTFKSSKGHNLQGFLYYYENPREDRLVVFDHGFGGGHLSYMKEIEMLCRRGLRVFAYDHTGCMRSEGMGAGGMAQSLCDLNDAFCFIKEQERFRSCTLSVMGHSWGGFSSANIAALHSDIQHVVVLSGFLSVKRLIHSFFGGLLAPYRSSVLALEAKHNEPLLVYDATETLKAADARILLVYSDNDPLCTRRAQYEPLAEALSGRENITLRLERGKGHNPNYTHDAVAALANYSRALRKIQKKKNLTAEDKHAFVSSFDWERITAQDSDVWNAIYQTLEV